MYVQHLLRGPGSDLTPTSARALYVSAGLASVIAFSTLQRTNVWVEVVYSLVTAAATVVLASWHGGASIPQLLLHRVVVLGVNLGIAKLGGSHSLGRHGGERVSSATARQAAARGGSNGSGSGVGGRGTGLAEAALLRVESKAVAGKQGPTGLRARVVSARPPHQGVQDAAASSKPKIGPVDGSAVAVAPAAAAGEGGRSDGSSEVAAAVSAAAALCGRGRAYVRPGNSYLPAAGAAPLKPTASVGPAHEERGSEAGEDSAHSEDSAEVGCLAADAGAGLEEPPAAGRHRLSSDSAACQQKPQDPSTGEGQQGDASAWQPPDVMRYRPFVRHTTAVMKLEGPGVEPEALGAGWQRRVQQAVLEAVAAGGFGLPGERLTLTLPLALAAASAGATAAARGGAGEGPDAASVQGGAGPSAAGPSAAAGAALAVARSAEVYVRRGCVELTVDVREWLGPGLGLGCGQAQHACRLQQPQPQLQHHHQHQQEPRGAHPSALLRAVASALELAGTPAGTQPVSGNAAPSFGQHSSQNAAGCVTACFHGSVRTAAGPARGSAAGNAAASDWRFHSAAVEPRVLPLAWPSALTGARHAQPQAPIASVLRLELELELSARAANAMACGCCCCGCCCAAAEAPGRPHRQVPPVDTAGADGRLAQGVPLGPEPLRPESAQAAGPAGAYCIGSNHTATSSSGSSSLLELLQQQLGLEVLVRCGGAFLPTRLAAVVRRQQKVAMPHAARNNNTDTYTVPAVGDEAAPPPEAQQTSTAAGAASGTGFSVPTAAAARPLRAPRTSRLLLRGARVHGSQAAGAAAGVAGGVLRGFRDAISTSSSSSSGGACVDCARYSPASSSSSSSSSSSNVDASSVASMSAAGERALDTTSNSAGTGVICGTGGSGFTRVPGSPTCSPTAAAAAATAGGDLGSHTSCAPCCHTVAGKKAQSSCVGPGETCTVGNGCDGGCRRGQRLVLGIEVELLQPKSGAGGVPLRLLGAESVALVDVRLRGRPCATLPVLLLPAHMQRAAAVAEELSGLLAPQSHQTQGRPERVPTAAMEQVATTAAPATADPPPRQLSGKQGAGPTVGCGGALWGSDTDDADDHHDGLPLGGDLLSDLGALLLLGAAGRCGPAGGVPGAAAAAGWQHVLSYVEGRGMVATASWLRQCRAERGA
ncbi:hypothetical protein HYH02_007305 [Chlamydomonas schloesseri]|uniref:Uncharacterized protein n=1 Tax=Chlamydomonas schloesseri TaxID=2026947 RepID=A0A836B5G9_9CHLO|nr:hypothetical protein HYH02_007305 [Chlamydomonas schloesseri]|eukprot:KAG2447849.1 hypothetical protein HYH02_007305 [Chlamydomonas schloesseri]